MAVVTLSRQMGSQGDEVARMVAESLGLRLIGREIINQAAIQAGVPEVALSEIDELGLLGMKPRPEALRLYRETVSRMIQELAEAGNLLLVGRGGQIILAGRADTLHVQVIAPRASRIKWTQEQRSITADVAAALVDASDHTRVGIPAPALPGALGYPRALRSHYQHGTSDSPGRSRDHPFGHTKYIRPPRGKRVTVVPPPFAHPVEAEFARILDFYGIPWQYEPRTFSLQCDEQGHVTEAFSPDFYLPDQDLYVELTTMQPHQIRHKNHKVRRLRELYPDINIKLFKRGDLRNLLIKYGLEQFPDLLDNQL